MGTIANPKRHLGRTFARLSGADASKGKTRRNLAHTFRPKMGQESAFKQSENGVVFPVRFW